MPTNSHEALIDQITDEFLERRRRGQRPQIAEYVEQYPELAEEIRATFPAAALMEDFAPRHSESFAEWKGAEEEINAPQRLGDFRIIREVGRGGMGIVYEAEQESLGRRVALKVLPKQFLLDAKHCRRFEREARATALLHHTNIVPVFGVGRDQGLQYYAMQFIHGLALDDVLEQLRQLEGTGAVLDGDSTQAGTGSGREPQPLQADERPPAAERETASCRLSATRPLSGPVCLAGSSGSSSSAYYSSVARIGFQAASALEYAHEHGILHRDVKPSNLLLDSDGTVWVTDFGLAKAEGCADLTATGDIIGTLRYMAPEQLRGEADARSDVYALGLTLYELLALRPAYDEPDRRTLVRRLMNEPPRRLRSVRPHVPRDLETIVHKAIDRDPSARYQTAGELAADLQRYLNAQPVLARRVSPLARLVRWCKCNRAIAGLASTIALLLLVGMGVSAAAAVRYRTIAQENLHLAQEKDRLLKVAEAARDRERRLWETIVKNLRYGHTDRDALIVWVLSDEPEWRNPRRKAFYAWKALNSADGSIVQQVIRDAIPRIDAELRVATQRLRETIDTEYPGDADAHWILAAGLAHFGEVEEARRHVLIGDRLKPQGFPPPSLSEWMRGDQIRSRQEYLRDQQNIRRAAHRMVGLPLPPAGED